MRFAVAVCLLAVLATVNWLSSAELTKTQREKLCSRSRDGCIWLNAFFNKSHGFPIHGTVDYDHDLEVYCYEGAEPLSSKGLAWVWSTLHIKVKCEIPDYVHLIFSNTSVDIVNSENVLRYPNDGNITFSHDERPYNVFCVAVKYNGRDFINYELYADVSLEWRFPVLLGIGTTLFFYAKTLSRSMTFHYGTGITFGVLASLLVLFYLFSKVVPKKNVLGLGVIAGGFTLVGSFLYWLAKNALEVATTMWQYLLIYVFVAGVISFAVMYRFGPVENPRTFNLIQWSIQLFALILIALASQLTEVGLAFVSLALLFYLVPARYNPLAIVLYPVVVVLSPVYRCLSRLLAPCRWCLRCLCGPRYKYRFLTMDEYEEQGRVETRKALKELREYCRQNHIYGVIGRLGNTKRFTNFLSGNDHVTDQEQVDYDYSFTLASTDGDYSDNDDNYSASPSRLSQQSQRHHSPSLSSSYASSTHSTSFQHTTTTTASDDSPAVRPHPSPSSPSSSSAHRPHPSPPQRAPLRNRYPRDTSSRH